MSSPAATDPVAAALARLEGGPEDPAARAEVVAALLDRGQVELARRTLEAADPAAREEEALRALGERLAGTPQDAPGVRSGPATGAWRRATLLSGLLGCGALLVALALGGLVAAVPDLAGRWRRASLGSKLDSPDVSVRMAAARALVTEEAGEALALDYELNERLARALAPGELEEPDALEALRLLGARYGERSPSSLAEMPGAADTATYLVVSPFHSGGLLVEALDHPSARVRAGAIALLVRHHGYVREGRTAFYIQQPTLPEESWRRLLEVCDRQPELLVELLPVLANLPSGRERPELAKAVAARILETWRRSGEGLAFAPVVVEAADGLDPRELDAYLVAVLGRGDAVARLAAMELGLARGLREAARRRLREAELPSLGGLSRRRRRSEAPSPDDWLRPDVQRWLAREVAALDGTATEDLLALEGERLPPVGRAVLEATLRARGLPRGEGR